MAEEAGTRTRVAIRSMVGDTTVLCVVLATQEKAAIVVNERYPEALAHAERHLASNQRAVWICRPDCRD